MENANALFTTRLSLCAAKKRKRCFFARSPGASFANDPHPQSDCSRQKMTDKIITRSIHRGRACTTSVNEGIIGGTNRATKRRPSGFLARRRTTSTRSTCTKDDASGLGRRWGRRSSWVRGFRLGLPSWASRRGWFLVVRKVGARARLELYNSG